jgi:hypothetical protein
MAKALKYKQNIIKNIAPKLLRYEKNTMNASEKESDVKKARIKSAKTLAMK